MTVPPELAASLARQRDRGLLGPDGAEALVAHSQGFAAVVPAPTGPVVDLGSGAGVPGLVLAATRWADARITLVDASQRRCTYLELEVAALDLAPRVDVRWARGEELGREDAWRGRCELVVARSFGPPAAVAECGAPLLAPGGRLVVSEPPEGGGRWPDEGLAELGLGPAETHRVGGATYVVLPLVEGCPERFPRRPGLPARTPLF